MKQSIAVSLVFTVLAVTCWCKAQEIGPDIEPFRLDEIEGRQLKYSDMSFLHRFTYRQRPGSAELWRGQESGFTVTAGSVSSKELYLIERLSKNFDLGDGIVGEILFRRTQDFDTEYDRLLSGLGYQVLPNLQLKVLADFSSNKGELDIFWNLEWSGDEGELARFSLVQVDAYFNSKSKRGRYEQDPYTLFFSYQRRINEQGSVLAWINWNSPLELQLVEDESSFSYKQLTFGSFLTIPWNEGLMIDLRAYRQTGDRSRWALNPASPNSFEIDRSAFNVELQARFVLSSSWQPWIGLRVIDFDEEDQRLANSNRNSKTDLREYLLHFGSLVQLSDKWLFWPGVYINTVDHVFNYPEDEALSRVDGTTFAKVTLPFEYSLPNYDAKITLNPTLEFPRSFFGGFNVQVQVLF